MELLYVTDPMCSWCWGFAEVVQRMDQRLRPGVSWRLVMGGLAQDSDQPMSAATRTMVQGAWDAVEAACGARFNRGFWQRCAPRRSTWPACRAVHAARRTQQDRAWDYFKALQRAYYLEARNPSDDDTLIAVADEQGLDTKIFQGHLTSDQVAADLANDLAECVRLGMRGFPSLVLMTPKGPSPITRGWQSFESLEPVLLSAGVID